MRTYNLPTTKVYLVSFFWNLEKCCKHFSVFVSLLKIILYILVKKSWWLLYYSFTEVDIFFMKNKKFRKFQNQESLLLLQSGLPTHANTTAFRHHWQPIFHFPLGEDLAWEQEDISLPTYPPPAQYKYDFLVPLSGDTSHSELES